MESKGSPRRGYRNYMRRRIRRSTVLEGIAQCEGVASQVKEDGSVRMKITVRKEDLKQVLSMIGVEKKKINTHQMSPISSPYFSEEDRLNLLRRKHLLRGNAARKSTRRSWSPQLHSIPEE